MEPVVSANTISNRLSCDAPQARIRVMHIITELGVGGTEMMLRKLLLASNGKWDSMVVSLGSEGTMTPRIAELGIPVRCLRIRRSAPNPFRLFPILALVHKFCPQIIQGWLIHGNLIATLAGVAAGKHVPVFWGIRQSLYDTGAEPWGTSIAIRAGALLSWFPEKLIYVSRVSAQHHERLGYATRKRVIVPNGIDCQTFRPNEEARCQVLKDLGFCNDTTLVGLVARYHPMKDHANFVRAARIAARKYSSVHFLLAGKGVTSGQVELKKLIDEQGMRGSVSLLGERSDIAQITSALDIACSASWTEGFSNSIGEAMACGVPCVVTDVGDSAYLVGDTGLIVPARNPEALARAICELIDAGPAKRKVLGMAARRRIENEFSLPEIARRYQDLYQNCLDFAR